MGLLASGFFLFFAQPYVSTAKGYHVSRTFEALENLKLAGDNWDTVVNEAFGLLESEERRCVACLISYSGSSADLMNVVAWVMALLPLCRPHPPLLELRFIHL